jgi:hypothetical protein
MFSLIGVDAFVRAGRIAAGRRKRTGFTRMTRISRMELKRRETEGQRYREENRRKN